MGKQHFRVRGAWKDSGVDTESTVEAVDAKEAEGAVGKLGIYVASVEQLTPAEIERFIRMRERQAAECRARVQERRRREAAQMVIGCGAVLAIAVLVIAGLWRVVAPALENPTYEESARAVAQDEWNHMSPEKQQLMKDAMSLHEAAEQIEAAEKRRQLRR